MASVVIVSPQEISGGGISFHPWHHTGNKNIQVEQVAMGSYHRRPDIHIHFHSDVRVHIFIHPLPRQSDSFLPARTSGEGFSEVHSFLRIKSSLDQIISIFNIQDEEDLARLGTNRMAQAIPKLELLYNENKEATGFGFLDSPDNTPTKYIIYNDLYFEEYSEENWEVANSIEIAALEIFTSIGWVGLAVHIIFFVMLWMTVRKKRNANYFLSVVIAFAWFGIGGFEGLIRAQSLYLIGLTYGIVLLCNRPDRPREPQDLPLSYNDPYNTQA